ncbi:MAG: alpha/beta fold hydrolase [Anaerolineae bacterium]|nr:alpha/beta fold hydrolase [Anaerolineae bacterium]
MPTALNPVLGIVATLAAVIVFMAWLLSGRVVHRRAPDPPCTPDVFDVPFEHIAFPTRDGIQLGGRMTGGQRRRPVVIFCAGMFGSMDGDTHLVPVFVEAGFDVLQFDWRAHGASDGARTTLGVREVLDVQGAIDFLQARGVQRIGLMGFSFGGAVALRAAAQDRRVCCVACDGGFVTLQSALGGYLKERLGTGAGLFSPFLWLVLRLVELRLGLRLSAAEPPASVGAISPRAVLFIHGENDALVPPAEQDRLFAACGEPKALWRIEGAGHRQGYELQPEEYQQRAIGFFRQYLM